MLTLEELRAEVRKAKSFTPPLSQFVIATTAPRDARLQQEARVLTQRHERRGLFSVHVYGWEDITDLLSHHPRVYHHYYGSPGTVQPHAKAPLFPEETMVAAFRAEERIADSEYGAPGEPLVLPAHAIQALGLVATSPVPLPEKAYTELFPAVRWKDALGLLLKAQAVRRDDAVLSVPPRTVASLLPSQADRGPFIDSWIAALEPLRGHIDMALLLGIHRLSKGHIEQAVDALVKAAEGLEPGVWSDLYEETFLAFDQAGVAERLSGDRRLQFIHATALCVVRGRSPAAAIPWVLRLRREGGRGRQFWAVAQSYILAGLAYDRSGRREEAQTAYSQAASYAGRHRLWLLVGHALHNLAMLRASCDPEAAERILEESLRAKERAGDEFGRVGGLIGRGLIAAGRGQYGLARSWFARAEKLAARLGMRHAQTIASYNVGTALLNQGRSHEALPHYAATRELAEQEGFTDTLALAVGGEAMARLELGHFSRASEKFVRLHHLQRERGSEADAVIALHDAGVCLLKQRKEEEARKLLERALADARQQGIMEWVYRCGNPKRGDRASLRDALRVLRKLYGHTLAAEFGPLALKACRTRMIRKGWARTYINCQIDRIRRMFRWAAEDEWLPGGASPAWRRPGT